MNKRIQLTAGLAATIGVLSACGASGGESVATDASRDDAVVETVLSATTPPTEPAVTEPAVTDPPATDPPATEPPVTDPPEFEFPEGASGETVTVQSETGPLELTVELARSCETARSFYTTANGLNFVRDEQVGTLQQLFAELAAMFDPPTGDSTATPDQLAVMILAFEEIGYDSSRISEVSDPESLFAALEGFQATQSSLRPFLVESCGADEDALDEQAREIVAVAAEAAGEVIEPAEPVEAVPGTPITNEASTIKLQVPADWTETDEPVGEYLVAAPDIEAFYAMEAPGVLVLRGKGGFRDGGFVGRVLSFESDLEEEGCVLVDELGYDDGVYVGQERLYACPTEGLDVRLFGGIAADEVLYAMVLVVHPSDELGIRELIATTVDVV